MKKCIFSEIFFLIFTDFFFFFDIGVDFRLPYYKVLYERKLISNKKWRQSTAYKKVAKVCFLLLRKKYKNTVIKDNKIKFLESWNPWSSG